MNFMREVIWDDYFPLIKLIGSGARKFLHGQTTANLLDKKDNSIIRTCWLSHAGIIRSLLEVRFTDKGAELLVLSGDPKDLFDGFDNGIFPADKVFIEPAIKIRRLQKLTLKFPWRQSEVHWCDESDLIKELFNRHDRASQEEFEEWRLIQGFPAWRSEIDGKTNPFELGLFDLVSLDKGCYLGQETMARLIRSGFVRQKLRYLQSDKVFKVGQRLINNREHSKEKINAGYITSVAKSADDKYIGLAFIKNNYSELPELLIEDSSNIVYLKPPIGFIEIQDKS